MIRSGEGCIREDKSNFLVHMDFQLPLGPETTIENGCLKVILVNLTRLVVKGRYISFSSGHFVYVLA